MDEIGEVLVVGAILWFLFDDDRLTRWPFMLGVLAVGLVLYCLGRVLD